MAKTNTSIFGKPPKGCPTVVPCRDWENYVIEEFKAVTVRLLGHPIRLPVRSEARYAIHCFDRADGKLKVLEGPHDLFEQFAQFHRHGGLTSSGVEAPDFRIALALRQFRYFATPLKTTTLTEGEQSATVGGILDLDAIYKTGREFNRFGVWARLGLWPRCLWPTKHQDQCNAASAEQLVATEVIIRFPSRSDFSQRR